MKRMSIGIQVFNKADMAISTLNSIIRCNGIENFDIFILQDGLKENKLMGSYVKEHFETKNSIKEWIKHHHPKNIARSITFIEEELGRGTAPTAKYLIDIMFECSDFCVFTEDDVIFEKDALHWFQNMSENSEFHDRNIWAIAGESKLFDSKGRKISDLEYNNSLLYAKNEDLICKYATMKLMPSSCFATSSDKWQEFSDTRGMYDRGPMRVNKRCQSENKKVIWPAIARCCDIGMHHPIGYSMTLKKDTSKIPQKSNYITSKTFGYYFGDFKYFEKYQYALKIYGS